ncbi:Kunitz/Bovine pancreatic trypsin inhibitor domain protein [Ancylostoma duodenale]|uniref:Kunitz/Bovine pancreatic trypsin inhibitor domain protein n=1 Tax=Ancylostoma duodenale TaxID=51022 RepID=A0A0C2CWX1_9BILA|nr:Kunitz/Bovine pancreatic trypsin inhibitor domain protein [Ancylostoma duodenale]
MCGLPPQQGTQCGASFVSRYYFNIVTGQCTSFQFGGCDGNYNNFLTVQQCRTCPAGNVAYVDPNSQMPIQCNDALSNSCPSGYTCTFNALINGHVCCGASDYGVCPENEKAFISTSDMSPRECVVNIDASCPPNYLCRFNMQRNKNLSRREVPAQGLAYVAAFSLHHGEGGAVPGWLLVSELPRKRCARLLLHEQLTLSKFLGSVEHIAAVCPDEAEFVIDEHSQLPRACTMGSFVGCPNGFSCRSLTSNVEGFCCRTGSSAPPAITDGCPPGNYVFTKEGEVAPCDPFNPPNAPCPDGFTCQWSMANQKYVPLVPCTQLSKKMPMYCRYQCCGSNPAPPPARVNDGCPNAQVAFRDRGTVQVCTAGSSTCPPGYFCQFSSLNRQFQCCGVSGGCPADSVAFVGLSGEPEKCVVGQSKCPFGFACRRSVAGHHICCTARQVTCSDEEVSVDGMCLSRAPPGAACRKSEQCTGGSVCHLGVCECPTLTTPIGGFCQGEIKCGPEQVKHGGACHNKVELGKACVVTQQCPDRSSCVLGMCQCDASLSILNGKCVSASARSKIVQIKGGSSKCANPNSKPLLSEDTGRVVFCSPKTKQCPTGYTCQVNNRKTQYMCCTDVPQQSQEVCPSGRVPYLLNGLPQRCTTQRCPRGYECTYKDHDYVCCSSAGKAGRRVPTTAEGDPSGEPGN